jgi:hypothetical protein
MMSVAKIAAYITVFYEKRPSKIFKVGVDNNISWEIASIDCGSYLGRKSSFRRNDEYIMLMIFSILVIVVFTIMFFQIGELKEITKSLGFLISGLYLFISLWLLCKIHGLLRNFSRVKGKYLKAFFQYSLDTGHYTEEEIEERFGNFWRNLDAKKA